MADSDPNELSVYDFIFNDFLTQQKGEQLVSSSMFNKIFIMGNRVPKELIDQIADNPQKIEDMLTANIPLFQTSISKRYWVTQNRGFDKVNVDIYGAICLADDRHLLDCLIAHGNIINGADKYTLRQVAEGCGLQDVAWEFTDLNYIDKPMLNRGIYFHISVKDLFKALGLKAAKKNRETILKRLRRLSIMKLVLSPVSGETVLTQGKTGFSFVDEKFFSLLDKSKIRNGIFSSDTYTNLIVNVSGYYVQSLKKDGAISRKRLKNHYVNLVGKNCIEDFYKSLEEHKREFLHGRELSFFINLYIDNKMSLFGINRNHKYKQIMQQIAESEQKLINHFNMTLEPIIDHKNKIKDYKLIYLGRMSNQ